jgi:hypothetical protein
MRSRDMSKRFFFGVVIFFTVVAFFVFTFGVARAANVVVEDDLAEVSSVKVPNTVDLVGEDVSSVVSRVVLQKSVGTGKAVS